MLYSTGTLLSSTGISSEVPVHFPHVSAFYSVLFIVRFLSTGAGDFQYWRFTVVPSKLSDPPVSL